MGDERIAFSAATEVDREDWGLTWNVALETGGMLVEEGPYRAQRASRRLERPKTKVSEGVEPEGPATDRTGTVRIIGAGRIGKALAARRCGLGRS